MFALHPVRVAFIGPQPEKVKAMGNTPNISYTNVVEINCLSQCKWLAEKEGEIIFSPMNSRHKEKKQGSRLTNKGPRAWERRQGLPSKTIVEWTQRGLWKQTELMRTPLPVSGSLVTRCRLSPALPHTHRQPHGTARSPSPFPTALHFSWKGDTFFPLQPDFSTLI